MEQHKRNKIRTIKISINFLLSKHKTHSRYPKFHDDLIENNLKRIKLLEQAAQNIYKEWFVNLRFPGHENISIKRQAFLRVGRKVLSIYLISKVVHSPQNHNGQT